MNQRNYIEHDEDQKESEHGVALVNKIIDKHDCQRQQQAEAGHCREEGRQTVGCMQGYTPPHLGDTHADKE